MCDAELIALLPRHDAPSFGISTIVPDGDVVGSALRGLSGTDRVALRTYASNMTICRNESSPQQFTCHSLSKRMIDHGSSADFLWL